MQAIFAHPLGQTIYLFLSTFFRRACKKINYSVEIRKMFLDVTYLNINSIGKLLKK